MRCGPNLNRGEATRPPPPVCKAKCKTGRALSFILIRGIWNIRDNSDLITRANITSQQQAIMPNGRTGARRGRQGKKQAENYEQKEATSQNRPDVGTQAQFKKKSRPRRIATIRRCRRPRIGTGKTARAKKANTSYQSSVLSWQKSGSW